MARSLHKTLQTSEAPNLSAFAQRRMREHLGDLIARKEATMLWTIFVVLLVLWLLGMVTSYTLGGFIHVLLVVALVMLVINLISGRRTVV